MRVQTRYPPRGRACQLLQPTPFIHDTSRHSKPLGYNTPRTVYKKGTIPDFKLQSVTAMAGTSPRRSIRARTTQPNSGSHHSSASSNSSGRADRNTRTSQKIESPRKSTPSGSLSSEPLEDSVAPTIEDTLTTRRRKRGQPDDQSKSSKSETIEISNGIDELVEDDEAVRCICGNEEYPGPPPLAEEDSKKGIKDSSEIELPITEADYTEDLAGFFVQCDTCKVWQHGLCVGIKSEEQSPDEYFCELCRKDLHRIFTASNG